MDLARLTELAEYCDSVAAAGDDLVRQAIEAGGATMVGPTEPAEVFYAPAAATLDARQVHPSRWIVANAAAAAGLMAIEPSWFVAWRDAEHVILSRSREERPRGTKPTPPPVIGAGTELKALLKRIGIVAQPNCLCNKRARLMDERGTAWCRANLETIVDWLAEEAARRKLPFVRVAGSLLCRRAIHNAEKKAKTVGPAG